MQPESGAAVEREEEEEETEPESMNPFAGFKWPWQKVGSVCSLTVLNPKPQAEEE